MSIRDQYAIPPELLEVEFTESIAFDNTALLLQTVARLKKQASPAQLMILEKVILLWGC